MPNNNPYDRADLIVARNIRFNQEKADPIKEKVNAEVIGESVKFIPDKAPTQGSPSALSNSVIPAPYVVGEQIQGSHSANILQKAVEGEYRYAMLGLILGLATIIGGVILGLHGVAGSTSWTAKLLGLESKLNDATPGVVLFVVGIFLVLLTRPKIKLKDLVG